MRWFLQPMSGLKNNANWGVSTVKKTCHSSSARREQENGGKWWLLSSQNQSLMNSLCRNCSLRSFRETSRRVPMLKFSLPCSPQQKLLFQQLSIQNQTVFSTQRQSKIGSVHLQRGHWSGVPDTPHSESNNYWTQCFSSEQRENAATNSKWSKTW